MKRYILSLGVVFSCVLGTWATTYKSGKLTFWYDAYTKRATLTKCDTSASGTVSVPAKVKGCAVNVVDSYAFKNCKKVKTVKFASKGLYFYDGAFLNCTALEKVSLPVDGVCSFDERIFAGCKKLKSFTLPYGGDLTSLSLRDSSIQTLTFLNLKIYGDVKDFLWGLAYNNIASIKTIVYPRGYAYEWTELKNEVLAEYPEAADYYSRVAFKQSATPRVWIDNDAARGTLTLKINGKKASNGATFKKGAKIAVSVKMKNAWSLTEIMAVEAAAAGMMVDGASLTIKQASGTDMNISTAYIPRVDERTALEQLGDSLLGGSDESGLSAKTINGVSVRVATVGRYFYSQLAGSDQLLTRTSFTATGLPSEVKFVRNGSVWYLEGVAGSTVDFATAPIYVTATSLSGLKVVRRLNLQVEAAADPLVREVFDSRVGVNSELVYADGDAGSFTASKPPKGFVYDPIAKTANFKPTAPGYVQVTLTRPVSGLNGGAYAEKRAIRYHVAPAANTYFPSMPMNLYGTAGVKFTYDAAYWFTGAKSPKVTGLPAGVKFDAKKMKFSGTPTKAGHFVVTVSKSVKGKTRTFKLPFEVEAGNVGGMLYQLGGAFCAWEVSENRQMLLAGNAGGVMLVPNKGVKVTASGLPKGVKLVKKADGSYVLGGRATTPGTYVVTFKMSGNGGTVTKRHELKVASHPFKGSYRGFVETPGVGIGTVSMTVDAAGKATITLVEGSLKTKVSTYATTLDWAYPSNPLTGEFEFSATLPAVKKYKLAKRKLKMVYWIYDGMDIEDVQVSLAPTSGSGKGTADMFMLERVRSASELTAMSVPSAKYAFTVDLKNDSAGTRLPESIIGTVECNVGAAKATVQGRLPRGKTFSLSLPITSVYYGGEPRCAPGFAVDADGTRYLFWCLPLSGDKISNLNFLVETQKGMLTPFDTDMRSLDIMYGGPNSPQLAFDAWVTAAQLQFTFKETAADGFSSLPVTFDANGKAVVTGATKQSCSYSWINGTGTLKFTKDGYSYTVYLQAVQQNPVDGGYLRGIIRRAKGKKVAWGSAVVVGPAG